ncbi:MAG: flagellar hook-associated protein FlgK [Planctomycetota bacterium]
MSLTSALSIGRGALTASQAAIQIASNNLANAATPGYSRQSARLSPLAGQSFGTTAIGGGVRFGGVQREINEAIQTRLLAARSGEAAASTSYDIYAQLENVLGELTGNDLSSQLNGFFNTWSERANLTDNASVVLQQGDQLAAYIQRLRTNVAETQTQIDSQISTTVNVAGDLLADVARLNIEIVTAEGGIGTAPGLRDQRDIVLGELADLMDINTVEQPDGQVDVLVGSTPIVLGSTIRELDTIRGSDDGGPTIRIVAGTDQREINIAEGQLGALIAARREGVDETLNTIDTLSPQLIFPINRLHSTGTNLAGLTRATAQLQTPVADRSLALNDPANVALRELPFEPVNGGFMLNVRRSGTDVVESVRIDIDLDGIDATGARTFNDDTSLDDIVAAINAVEGVTAGFTPDGRLDVNATSGFEFSFSDDSSNVLAVLGVNAYFTGTDGADIAVREDLLDNPALLMTGRLDDNGVLIENGTALAITDLQDSPLAELNGQSFRSSWQLAVQEIGLRSQSSRIEAESTALLREGVEAQRAATSGVSIDEESINLLTFQRQFQGAARVITTADEMLQTLLSLL